MAITRTQQARQMLKDGNFVMQGGVRNYLGEQKTVSDVPIKWQSGPDKPSTELAYITKAEKDLLLKKDIHGSLKDGPNKGPGGLMSLDSFGDDPTLDVNSASGIGDESIISEYTAPTKKNLFRRFPEFMFSIGAGVTILPEIQRRNSLKMQEPPLS